MKYLLDYTLLLESAFTLKKAKEDFLKKNKVDKLTFGMISSRDMSRNKKYTYWLIKQYLKDNTNLNHYVDQIGWYETNGNSPLLPIDKKDINKFTSAEVDKIMEKFTSKKTLGAKEGEEILYEDNRGNKLIKVTTTEAADKWRNYKCDEIKQVSTWCIGINKSMFQTYEIKKPGQTSYIYIIILPHEPVDTYKRIAITSSRGNFDTNYKEYSYAFTGIENLTTNINYADSYFATFRKYPWIFKLIPEILGNGATEYGVDKGNLIYGKLDKDFIIKIENDQVLDYWLSAGAAYMAILNNAADKVSNYRLITWENISISRQQRSELLNSYHTYIVGLNSEKNLQNKLYMIKIDKKTKKFEIDTPSYPDLTSIKYKNDIIKKLNLLRILAKHSFVKDNIKEANISFTQIPTYEENGNKIIKINNEVDIKYWGENYTEDNLQSVDWKATGYVFLIDTYKKDGFIGIFPKESFPYNKILIIPVRVGSDDYYIFIDANSEVLSSPEELINLYSIFKKYPFVFINIPNLINSNVSNNGKCKYFKNDISYDKNGNEIITLYNIYDILFYSKNYKSNIASNLTWNYHMIQAYMSNYKKNSYILILPTSTILPNRRIVLIETSNNFLAVDNVTKINDTSIVTKSKTLISYLLSEYNALLNNVPGLIKSLKKTI